MLLNLSKDELLCILGLLPQEVRCRTIPLLCKDLARVLRSSGAAWASVMHMTKPCYICIAYTRCIAHSTILLLHDACMGQGSCTSSWRWT